MTCLLILPYMLGFMGIPIMWTDLLFFPADPGFIIGPSIYFYLISQTNQEFRFKRKHLWHYVPYLVYVIYHLIVFLQGPAFVQNWLASVDLPYINPVERIATLISNYAYLYLSIRYYISYRRWIVTEFADTSEISFSWYRNFLIMVAVGITLSWAFNLLNDLGFNLTYTQNWWEYVLLSLFIYIISISGYQQPQLVYLQFEEKTPEPTDKATLSDQDMNSAKNQILQLMDQDALYLNPRLSLSSMASQLNMNTNTLSQVINSGFGKNFNDFVNEYRVEAVKQVLKDDSKQHLSLLGIAYDCGFNSKATFNRVFKKFTELSPSEYMKQA